MDNELVKVSDDQELMDAARKVAEELVNGANNSDTDYLLGIADENFWDLV